jgi:BirA family transcriptional regulator, biotin operon repressor / biotin---[acetyl-CoA-carboxylase] ligase
MTAAFDLARLDRCGLVASIDYHESIGSTSDRALALAAADESQLPLLVLAARQTAGRGRGTNRWWSDEGALTFSLALEAPPALLPAANWPQVALIAGLAVCEALHGLAPSGHFRVKWPNDVYLSDGKISGILSESVPGWRDRLVVGIGINVNNQVAGDLYLGTSHAASLIESDGLARDLTDVLIAVLDHFDHRWRSLLHESFAPLAVAYRNRCFLTGKAVTIEQAGGKWLVGVCQGIDDSGAMRLSSERGEQRIVSGSINRWDVTAPAPGS